MEAEKLNELFAEFPQGAISWRAQSLSPDKKSALALAYIDARDVMDRLDEICGPENWQDRYEFHGPRTVCYLSIRVNDEWVTKADGAGDSDVEAEKGAISDALKRAAVKWGIGRYLYSLKSPWVPCEIGNNGKWRKWTADPWDHVKGKVTIKTPPKPSQETTQNQADREEQEQKTWEATENLFAELEALTTVNGLKTFWEDNKDVLAKMNQKNKKRFADKKDELKAKFAKPRDVIDSIVDTFPGAKVVNDTVRVQSTLEAG